MALNSGINNYTNSMAKAMMDAFQQAWPEYMEDQDVPDPNPQMELMFVAVARGVVKHLMEHPEAFQFTVSNHAGHSHGISGGGGILTNGAHNHGISLNIDGE